MSPTSPRAALRQQALQSRQGFHASPDFLQAQTEVTRHLQQALIQLEPLSLGCYWALPGEFNPLEAIQALQKRGNSLDWVSDLSLALPYAQKTGGLMHYRPWQIGAPTLADECGIPSSTGKPVAPEVVLVPCVAYTRSGYRLGYGGGYFDRWLAAHPEVTAVGLAWHGTELSEEVFMPAAHDQALACIITDQGIVAD